MYFSTFQEGLETGKNLHQKECGIFQEIVRMKQMAHKGAAIPGTKGDKVHKKAMQMACRKAAATGLKWTYSYQPPEMKN